MSFQSQNKLNSNIKCFDIPKSQLPTLEGLSEKNHLKMVRMLMERQDFKDFKIGEDEDKAAQIIKTINRGKIPQKEDLEYLRAAFTEFDNNDKFWSEKISFKEKLVFLLNALQIMSDTKFKVENLLTPKISDDELEKKKREIIKTAIENEEFDTRASENVLRNIKFEEDLKLPSNYQNIYFEFIRETEKLYRTSFRKSEESSSNSKKRELGSNHLLRVARIGTGILTAAWQNPAKFTLEEKIELEKLKTPKEFLIMSLIALGHDLLEDGKFENPAELQEFIKNIAEKYFPENEAQEIADRVTESVDRLNTKNYINEDGTRDYETYINGRGKPGNADYVRPLNFVEKLVKFSDISHNYQSKVKTSDSENLLKNKEVKEKIKVYGKFMVENIAFLDNLPERIAAQFFKFNFIPLQSDKNWKEVFKVIHDKKI